VRPPLGPAASPAPPAVSAPSPVPASREATGGPTPPCTLLRAFLRAFPGRDADRLSPRRSVTPPWLSPAFTGASAVPNGPGRQVFLGNWSAAEMAPPRTDRRPLGPPPLRNYSLRNVTIQTPGLPGRSSAPRAPPRAQHRETCKATPLSVRAFTNVLFHVSSPPHAPFPDRTSHVSPGSGSGSLPRRRPPGPAHEERLVRIRRRLHRTARCITRKARAGHRRLLLGLCRLVYAPDTVLPVGEGRAGLRTRSPPTRRQQPVLDGRLGNFLDTRPRGWIY